MSRRTISSAPRMTPQRTLLNHKPPSKASSGSSTNSASGFSSNVRINDGWDGVGLLWRLMEGDGGGAWTTPGVIFKNVLNPTYFEVSDIRSFHYDIDRHTFAITSPTSLKSEHLPIPERARKSSMRRVPMLYPIFSSCLFTSS